MKVLHLLSGGGIGGIEMLCRDIARLSRDQHEFCFLYSGGEIAEEMKMKNVPVYLYYSEKLPVRMIKIWELMRREKYDVVIVHHEGIGIYSFYLMLLYCFPKARFVKYLHCSFEDKYFYTGNRLKDRINYNILKKTLLKSDVCVAVSEFVKKSYCDEFNCDADCVKVVYNGIEVCNEIQNRSEVSDGSIGLLYIGRLAEVKGVHLLLHALKRLIDRGERVFLEILGDGPMRNAYENLVEELDISEYVCFEGKQLRKQKFFDKSQIFIYPSIWQEAFGISIVEALAQGKICVASRTGGIPEIITDGEDGFLFAGGSVDALTEALTKALETCRNTENMDQMRQKAIQKAAEFDIRNMVEHLQQIYRQAAEE